MRTQDLVSGSQSSTELFMNAICKQAKLVAGLPYVLTFAPLAQVNPFQRLLYCRAAQAGYAIVPNVQFESLATINWSGRAVIHLHWLASVLSNAESEDDAMLKVRLFEEKILRWRKNGHKVLWTMHNVLPHGARFQQAEIALRKVIVEQADLVHILTAKSTCEAQEYFDVPEAKLIYIPHPSYEGWYANVNDRQNARADLDVDPDEFTFVQFGSLQRYKGVLELVDAFKHLQKKYPSRAFRLIIAGSSSDKEYMNEIVHAIADSSQIRLIQTVVLEKEIQTLFNAADVIVAPYVKTLNSGVALLAATFGKSLVAPNVGGVAETFQEDTTLLYSAESGDHLLDALERSLSYEIPKTVFDRILSTHKPEAISADFFEVITRRMFAPVSICQEVASDA